MSKKKKRRIILLTIAAVIVGWILLPVFIPYDIVIGEISGSGWIDMPIPYYIASTKFGFKRLMFGRKSSSKVGYPNRYTVLDDYNNHYSDEIVSPYYYIKDKYDSLINLKDMVKVDEYIYYPREKDYTHFYRFSISDKEITQIPYSLYEEYKSYDVMGDSYGRPDNFLTYGFFDYYEGLYESMLKHISTNSSFDLIRMSVINGRVFFVSYGHFYSRGCYEIYEYHPEQKSEKLITRVFFATSGVPIVDGVM